MSHPDQPRRFAPMSPQVDLPALERTVLQRWADTDVFARSLERTADGPRWVFYEGPPTANGKPGTHTSRPGSSRTCSPGSRR